MEFMAFWESFAQTDLNDRPRVLNSWPLRLLSLADVILLPAFILWFIWRLQYTTQWTWLIFVLWLPVSFLLHRDTPKMLGWRADNFWPAAKQASVLFGLMLLVLILIGLALGAPLHLPPNLIAWRRLETYCAFCVLQQVALNSLLHNRMLSLIRSPLLAAVTTGAIFAACHWPNPVLVPLTFVGGTGMAWLFGRVRNIIPLAIAQALIGSLTFWAFPVAWHNHLRVGPGYFFPAGRP
jgi:hypothetical protein